MSINGFVCTEKGELLNKYVMYCTFIRVDVVRTAGVRLLEVKDCVNQSKFHFKILLKQ